jgi:hypothetical protein
MARGLAMAAMNEEEAAAAAEAVGFWSSNCVVKVLLL